MSRTSTPLSQLKVGDLIYADVTINKADMADPTSKSATASKIRNGKPVKRICVVLEDGTTHGVVVTYVATFDQSTTLPRALDKTMWYPFKPATKEGNLNPLPPLSNNKAQWASLRIRQTITTDPAEKLAETILASSANLIEQNMKA